MRKSSETLQRQWTLLERVPRAPRARSTAELHQSLRDEGFDMDIRTVQRDLDWLSARFPLVSETEGRTNYWHWMEDASGLEIPSMSPSAALAMGLTQTYLASILPNSVLQTLNPYFERATEVLNATRFARWEQKVSMIQYGPRLIAPEVDEQVRQAVTAALLEGRCFKATYQSRHSDKPKTYDVHPLGLVVRQQVFYLVCTINEYQDVRHLALHRMSSAELLDAQAKDVEGFDLTAFIEDEGEFSYPMNPKRFRLELLVNKQVARHLRECRLSEDQVMEQEADDLFRLKADVADTMDLRWWLLGFGSQVEVIRPALLRKEIGQSLREAAQRYQGKA